MADRNTADYRCAECGASIPSVAGLCLECADAINAWFGEDVDAAAERAHARQQERDQLGETAGVSVERELRDSGRKT